VTSNLLASLVAKDGVVVPMGAADPPMHKPEPLDPMAEPGIIAAETHWISRLTTIEAASTGEVERGPQGDVGSQDPLVGAPEDAAVVSSDHNVSDPGITLVTEPDADVAAEHDVSDPGITLVTRPAPTRFAVPATSAPVPPIDAYSLRLIATHQLWDAGVGVQHSSHLAGLAAAPSLRANPHDLKRLGHESGGRVKAVSPRGSLVLTVEADTGVPRGSVALGFNLPGEGAADLIDATAAITNVRLDSV
jgi:anaerobic selenocysteine-containing dehydrogenase